MQQAFWAQTGNSVLPATQAGNYTTVRGTVRLARTNQPLAGVLLAIETCSYGTLGAIGFGCTGDSARTDAQGRYELRFRPQQEGGTGYVVRFDPVIGRVGRPRRFAFKTNAELVGPDKMPDSRYLKPGVDNIADFAPDFASNLGAPIDLHLPPKGH